MSRGRRTAPADPTAGLRPAVEAVGTALGAAWTTPTPAAVPTPAAIPALSDPGERSFPAGLAAPDLLRALLAVGYRVVAVHAAAARCPDLAPWVARLAPDRGTWRAIAEAVSEVGPLGALGIAGTPPAADAAPALPAPTTDRLAARLLALDVPSPPAAAFLAALPTPPGPGAPDPLGLADVHQALLACVPAWVGAALSLDAPGAGRRASGSFYTPAPVVDWLLDAALEPPLAAAAGEPDPAAALRALRICDPACGAGAFLLAAARRLRERLAASGDPRRAASDAARAVRGVDLDPLAVLLCRLALWVDALPAAGPDRAALAAHLVDAVRRGDALLGADAALVDAGVPDLAFAPGPGDDRALLRAWRDRNRAARAEPTSALFAPPITPLSAAAADAWCAAFFWPRGDVPPPTALPSRALPTPAPTAALVAALADQHGFLHWDLAFPDVAALGGFDVVLGNPPFLNQLERDTVASRPAANLLRARFAGLVGAYTDTATLLLLQGARLLRPGGRLGMVAPQSVLAAQDARAVRHELAERAPPTHAWWAGAHVFPGASVYVVALGLRRPLPGDPVAALVRAHGPDFRPLPPLVCDAALLGGDTWTPLIADALGAPALALRPGGRLGDLARATGDFRDEYYGLAPFVVDRAEADDALHPPLILTGHVDPAHAAWGTRPVRFGRRAWQFPRVDLAALTAEGRLAAWAAARRVPKLLVATQTRVLEAVADPAGRWLTTTPTLTVLPADGALWHVAAVLLGPVASAWALANYGATALAAGAIKLSAGQVEGIPLPTDRAAWDEAAALVAAAHAAPDAAERRACLLEAATASVRAYGADAALVPWWRDRLPAG